MHRIDRLSAILIQLQTKRVVAAKEIAERFHISIRTVYRDIRALEAAGIPIGSDPGLGYYLVEGYHLPPVMFTSEEAFALLTAGKLAEKFLDDAMKAHFDSALYKIKAILKDRDKDDLSRLNGRISVYKAAPDAPGTGPGFLADIERALCGKNVLSVEYRSSNAAGPVSRDIEPLSMGFYEYRWYLVAYCRLRKEYRNFRIDRIAKLTQKDEVFDEKRHPPAPRLWERMLENKNLRQVTVRFSRGTSGEIIKNRCILGFVEEKDLGGKTEMVLLVDSLEVLGKWLLEYTDDVEIIGPEELKLIMRKYAAAIAAAYLD
jgi:predicted DNA-binding transcriptional regulator YafY